MRNSINKYIVFFTLLLLFSCYDESKENSNIQASVNELKSLKENPLLLHPITFYIQPKDATMSALYGNDIAFNYLKNSYDFSYPEGSSLYEVTWKQKADEVWFGGYIPKNILKIEKVYVVGNKYLYELYKGKALKHFAVNDKVASEKIKFMTSQRMAVSP